MQVIQSIIQKYPELQAYVDEGEVKKLVSEYAPFVYRSEKRRCDCTDLYCPHKGIISPLGLFFLNERIHSSIKYKVHPLENLQPDRYPIKEYKDVYTITNKDFTDLYLRFLKPAPNLTEDSQLRRYFDLVEGIHTENPLIKKVVYVLNGQEIEVPVMNKFAMCPFPLFLCCMQYTTTYVYLYGEDGKEIKDTEVSVLGGNIDINRYTFATKLHTFDRKYNGGICRYSYGSLRIKSSTY